MPFVTSLFRYPVKGFTPESRDALTVQDDGRVAGDRVLAFRFADAAQPEDRDGLDHWPKTRGLALMDFPSLARLTLSYDDRRRLVRVALAGELLAEERLDPEGRRRLCEAVTDYVLATPDARRLRAAGRLPLALVGDGGTSRFQDRARGFVSLHAAASVAALNALVEAPVDDRRFRSNVVIDGVDAWEELSWAGRVTIGNVQFEARQPIGRCLAVQANPDTGERDARLLQVLTRDVGQAEPTLGILLLPVRGGGVIRVGDEVRAG
ncbi:MOSC domain-containing protein [Microbacterium sp. NPDC096154]|uniref:MOSC domain-containing protein n=1 Tax=Microbacterium sp. NPDC096154 TaxID=3155549 RepID=UPI0033315950